MNIKLLDGATGTNLLAAGMPAGVCVEKWILDNPKVLIDLQRAYAEAGADYVYAPTFGANSVALAREGVEFDGLNERLVALTRQACEGTKAKIAGDLSPTGLMMKPYGDASFEQVMSTYAKQAYALEKAEVDLFVIETSMSLKEATAAFEGVRSVSDKDIFVSFTLQEGCRTLAGERIEACLVALQARGAAAVGVNCSDGGETVLEAVKRMRPYAKIPIIAKPNAGLPETCDGKLTYSMTPKAFAEFCVKLANEGASYIGGCCGTTPEHIRELGVRGQRSEVRGQETGERKDMDFLTDGREIFIKDIKAPLPERIICDENLLFNLPEPDEAACFRLYIKDEMSLQTLDETPLYGLPLMISAANSGLLNKALQIYPGKALIDKEI